MVNTYKNIVHCHLIPIREILIGVSISVFFACHKQPESGSSFTDRFHYLDTVTTIPSNNPISKNKIALGKRLFFDTLLSNNQQLSCASCHTPSLAFSDGKKSSNIGASGKALDRNSPALFNLSWHSDFFWDGGKTSLENQAFGPLRNEDEMNMDLDTLMIRLRKHRDYPQLFTQAFEDGLIIGNVVKAIASYERSLVSFESKYDHYLNGKTELTSLELAGKRVFETNCSSCHTPPLFTDTKFHNNGLDNIFGNEFLDAKNGRYRITGKEEDLGKYKTPSLRNLAYTAPYMHDGRFYSLDEILAHYESPKNSPTLDTLLTKGIHLTIEEKENLLHFLNTLNDPNFVAQ